MTAPSSPAYLRDPVLDALARVVCEVTAELWAVRRRVGLLEAEVVRLGGRPLDAVPISAGDAAVSAAAAADFVRSVLAPLADLDGRGAEGPA